MLSIKNLFYSLFFLLFLISNISAKNLHSTLSSPQTFSHEETIQEIDPYDLGFIITLIHNKKFKVNAEQHIEILDEKMETIVKNINIETRYPFDKSDYKKQINFLQNKININSKYENTLAVSRDTIKINILQNNFMVAKTINAIIDGKNTFKAKKYFVTLLNDALKTLNAIDLENYKEIASVIKENDTNPISSDFKKSYEILDAQIKANIFVFTYLKSHMNQYRASNLLLDELSLKYVINQIDANQHIKNISDIVYYYFHISIGKIVILLSIFAIFFTINRKILPFLAKILTKKLSKEINSLKVSIKDILPSSFHILISIILYIFALHVSLFLLIDTASTLNKLIPWFNTIYLSLFSYLFYKILTNYINFSSDKIFDNYPNMRKEMVDFLLRILKVVIFILLGLFLLVQLGFDIKAIIASLGIGGIAIALAAKDTLTNFFGSLNIITDNSFSQGDWIEAGNVQGTVVDIRMRTTRIRTFANAMITVPNAQLANMSILNWSKRVIGRQIKMSVGITYESKMSDIENLVYDIREMLQSHSLIATSKLNIDKKPYLLKKEDLIGVKNKILVYIDEYGDSSINILVYCFSRSPIWEDWLETKQDIIIKISDLVEKNHCSFAFPTQTIHIEKEKGINL